MISLFPLQKIISYILVIYALFLFIIFSLFGNSIDTSSIFRFATFFEFIIFIIFFISWEYIWKKFPKLNDWIFPNLNGKWDVNINWSRENQKGVKEGIVHIKQNFLTMSMELITDESESETLLVHPKKNSESGRLILYYTYHNTPKNTVKESAPHKGTAILKVDYLENNNKLSGNYFTDRNTKGTLEFNRRLEK